ncbi:hypothetical protein [Streptomyces sp. NPDC048106]|uniref:hypothetical protein n=1 Tax=Streptomyces sp. NPDC048106 TaxID=3155750 RepID=UPI00345603D3
MVSGTRSEAPSDVPDARWRHDGFTAAPVRVPGGFRKRRLLPAVELVCGSVRTVFLCRDLGPFFQGRTDVVESGDGEGTIVLLCWTGRLVRSSAAQELLADQDAGSIALLTTKPAFSPIAVLPPDAAADFGAWYQALPAS